MKVKVKDKVLVIAGKYKGKTGNVMRVFKKTNRVTVEKVNIRTKHIKKTATHAGQIVKYEAPFNVSNVMVICPNCNKATRVAYTIAKKKTSAGKIDKSILRQKRFNDPLLSFRIQNNQLAQNISEKYLSIAPYKTNLIPFAKELLDNIYTKYEMIIITNGFEDVQKIKMEQTGLNKYFKKIISSDTCGYKKPEPSIFKLALNNLNGTRKESLMIGDSYHSDIWGAMQFGIDQAYLNPAYQKHKYQPTYSIRCLSELSVLL